MLDHNCNIRLVEYIILDNKVHCLGKNCYYLLAKGVLKMIEKILQNHLIPDLYFQVRIDEPTH